MGNDTRYPVTDREVFDLLVKAEKTVAIDPAPYCGNYADAAFNDHPARATVAVEAVVLKSLIEEVREARQLKQVLQRSLDAIRGNKPLTPETP